MSDDTDDFPLPQNVISLTDALSVRRHKEVKCKHRRFEVDAANKVVSCKDCGSEVSAYDALLIMAENREYIQERYDALVASRKALTGWKPHLLAVRELERVWRSRDMLPCCPHCGRGVEAGELNRSHINRKFSHLAAAEANHE
jgi:hypothetical protein